MNWADMLDGLSWTLAWSLPFACFVAPLVYLGIRSHHAALIKLQQWHEARDPLPMSQLPGEFGDDIPPEVAERVLRALARVATTCIEPADGAVIDPQRLRPTDRLSEDLGFELDSLCHVEFAYEIEREFGVCWPLREFFDDPTVGGVMRRVAAKLREAHRTIEPGVDYTPKRNVITGGIMFFRRLFSIGEA